MSLTDRQIVPPPEAPAAADGSPKEIERRTARRAWPLSRYDLAAIALLLGVTLFRLWYGARLGLAEDEAYYWQWSRHPSLSYYEQGPGIAWVIGAGTALFGHTLLGVRIGVILFAAGTGWLVYLTARRWFDERVGLWSVGLMQVAPLVAAGGVLATYDTPQIFFWAAALYALTRTVQENRAGGWYIVGLLVGLGGLIKSTALLFLPCALVFLLISPSRRRWLASPHPYLALGVVLLMMSPLVIWNAQHDWIGFRHNAAVGSRGSGAAPLRWVGDLLGTQALAVGPFLLIAEIAVLVGIARRFGSEVRSRHDEGLRFVWAFAATVLLLCVLLALRAKLEINWPAAAHAAGLMAVAAWLAPRWHDGSARLRAGIGAGIGLSALMTLILLFPPLLPAMGIRVSAGHAEKLNQTYGWTELARRVEGERRALRSEGGDVFVAASSYRVNSILAFYLPGQQQTHALYLSPHRRDQYLFWTDPDQLVGRDAVLVLENPTEESVALARQYFESLEELPAHEVYRPGFSGPVKTWYIYVGRRFRGYDPLAGFDRY